METKKYPSMIGCSIQRFHGYPDLYEEYGILNHRDNSYRLKIEVFVDEIYKIKEKYKITYYNEFHIKNVYNFIYDLCIVISPDYNFDGGVFDPNFDFKYNNKTHVVESATIFINPTTMDVNTIVSCIYHEIKHIFDYTLKAINNNYYQELLFSEYIRKYQLDLKELKDYNPQLIQNDEDTIMNCLSNFIDYVGISESSAYLENIDDSYKQDLNNTNKIKMLRYNGYSYQQIKSYMYRNINNGDYLKIYYNIEKYIKDILKLNNIDNINKKYKQNFKDIYNVDSIQKVLKIYLKRIQKVKEQSLKLFGDRYEKSHLQILLNKFENEEIKNKREQ